MLVVNGGFGLEVLGFSSTLLTSQLPVLNFEISAFASFSFKIITSLFFNEPVSDLKSLLETILLPSILFKVASNEDSESFVFS